MEQLGTTFAQAQTDFTVQVEVTPSDTYWTKLQAAGASGTLPDTFWMHARQFILYASSGLLSPIDDLISSAKIDLTQYPQQLVDLYSYEGKQYALPRNYNLIGLWYNKELFDAAKVDHPDDTWTWDTLADAAKELTGSGRFGFAAPMQNQTGYWNAIYQNGGQVISDDMTTSGWDDPATVEALDWWTGFIRTDKSSPTHQQMVETDPTSMFSSGKVAMMFGGDWQAGSFAKDAALADKIDVAVLPQGKQRAAILHGSGNVAAATSKFGDGAARLVQYLASEPAQQVQAKGGVSGPPAVTSVSQTWFDALPQFNVKAFVDEVDYGVLYPHSKNTDAWSGLESKILPDLFSGERGAQEVCAELAAAMNDVLAKEHG